MSKSLDKNNSVFHSSQRADTRMLQDILGISSLNGDQWYASIPFSNKDTTHGAENEYQTAVSGSESDTDLPISIRNSNYYSNISRRARSGDIAKRNAFRVEDFLESNHERIWENSWVRFPVSRLKASTMRLIMRDMALDKSDDSSPMRPDIDRFFFEKNGDRWIRIPSSYLLKISIADALETSNPALEKASNFICRHFLNDNSSPETFSFCPVSSENQKSAGKLLAEETLLRFLLSQFAVMYANRNFSLESLGQKMILYFAPSTPMRMRKLNSLISDSFYRELFMSPCLSGWDNGYKKHEYMHLCHQVLSRSHLNSVFKLKESGIISQSLVKLDTISNTSLANNGTHISTGSIILSELAEAGIYTSALEKSAGDLTIKIFEHFLPLFTPLYSSSPLRLSYNDFRPEALIGFLAHELDYTHLRMIWRRWIKKAGVEFFGRPFLPYGPAWYEKIWASLFRFKGDIVPDARLTDYLVALMSTPESPALNGKVGNDTLLRADLSDLGIFDKRMSMYLPYKLREHRQMGFTGFEGRFYSQFHSISEDMSDAADLQQLITAFAYSKVLKGEITHESIPDDPVTESERRHIFFSSAIGLKTVNIREKNPCAFIRDIISLAEKIRPSKRYNGYHHMRIHEYRLSLLKMLKSDPALVESLNAGELLDRLHSRIHGINDTHGKLLRGITGNHKNPIRIKADEFNSKAEHYYRNGHREKNIREALEVMKEHSARIESSSLPEEYKAVISESSRGRSCADYISGLTEKIISDTVSCSENENLMRILSLIISSMKEHHTIKQKEIQIHDSPVYRQKKFESGHGENLSR
jgi:hypothetical protein